MSGRKTIVFVCIMFLAALFLVLPISQAQEKAAAPQAKPTIAKLCTNCHQPEPGNLRGNFDSVAYKTQSLQLKIDDVTEIVKFDKATLKLENVPAFADAPTESLRSLKRGKEIRIAYTEKDGVKFATLVSGKAGSHGPGEGQVPPDRRTSCAALHGRFDPHGHQYPLCGFRQNDRKAPERQERADHLLLCRRHLSHEP
jgi:hypothetical protein